MPARSKAQQSFFGMVVSGQRPLPKGMTMKQAKEFASTPRKGLPSRAESQKKKRRRKIAAIRSRR